MVFDGVGAAEAVDWLVSSIPAMTILLMVMSLLACSPHMLCDAFQLLLADLCNLGYFCFYAVCSLVEMWSRKKRYQSNLCYFYAYIYIMVSNFVKVLV
jgi:hypothetical protein